MIKLSASKNNKRLTEFEDFKEYVIGTNVSVKRVKNQMVFKCTEMQSSKLNNGKYSGKDERMLFYYI